MPYNTITIQKPDDFHVHFRQGDSLGIYAMCTAEYFSRALVMPNTEPAIRNLDEVRNYQNAIMQALADSGFRGSFEPLMSFKIYPDATGKVEAWLQNLPSRKLSTHAAVSEESIADTGICPIAGKLYPQGVTTNSEDGVADVCQIYKTLALMQEKDIVLCIHGEDPQSFVLDRELKFLDTLDTIRRDFPALRIVLEHLSTKEAVDYVLEAYTHTSTSEGAAHTLAGTITVHHLLFTMDALLGGHLNPHMFCKPLLKTPKDLEALQKVVLARKPCFFLGTDSAPHKIGQKECAEGCAGVFSAPVAIALLTEFFYLHREKFLSVDTSAGNPTGNFGGIRALALSLSKGGEHDIESVHTETQIAETEATYELPSNMAPWANALEAFTSKYGADFYRLPYNQERITLVQSPWTVSQEIASVVPLCAGQEMQWKLATN